MGDHFGQQYLILPDQIIRGDKLFPDTGICPIWSLMIKVSSRRDIEVSARQRLSIRPYLVTWIHWSVQTSLHE